MNEQELSNVVAQHSVEITNLRMEQANIRLIAEGTSKEVTRFGAKLDGFMDYQRERQASYEAALMATNKTATNASVTTLKYIGMMLGAAVSAAALVKITAH